MRRRRKASNGSLCAKEKDAREGRKEMDGREGRKEKEEKKAKTAQLFKYIQSEGDVH